MRTRVGYAGGTTPSPTYRSIGDHTEALQVDYDPSIVSFDQLLEVFWQSHDPCRSGWSTQYKAILFYHDAEQERVARASGGRQAQQRGAPISTELVSAGEFTRAEDYHQKYYLRHRGALGGSFEKLYDSEREFTDSTAAAVANGWAGGHVSDQELRAKLRELGLVVEGDAVRRAGSPIETANRDR